jgi:hypothetical protein
MAKRVRRVAGITAGPPGFVYTARVRQLGIFAWLAALAACGKVQGSSDAGDPPPDGPPPPVRVTVLTYLADGAPELTARMIFQDPAGNVVFEGQVDAMGKLEAPLPEGGTVTEVRITSDTATSLAASITTITGVAPGDELTFGLKARPTIVNQGGQTSMTASYTPSSGATSHIFYTTCGTSFAGTTSPVTLTFRDSCHGPMFDLVGVASGGTLTTPRFLRLTNIAYQGGGSFTIPVGFSTMSNFTVNALNVPAEISSMSVRRASMLEHTAVASQSVSAGDPAAGTVSTIVPYGPTVGTRSLVALSFIRPDAVGTQTHTVHTSTLASSLDVDLGGQRVPWLTGMAGSSTGASWTVAVPGDTPDGMLTQWIGRWVIDNRTTTVTWRIAHPPSATGVTLPRLPGAHAALDPQAQTVPISLLSGSVLTVDYDVVNGYGEFRQQPDTLVTSATDTMGAFVGMPFQRRFYLASFSGQKQ